MAKKRKKYSARTGAKAVAAQSPEQREERALQALAAGQYRDAINTLKALLKDDAASERTPERRRALAEAYAGRAHALSAKGMLKEALAIWENRAALGPEIPLALDHSLLSLRLGDAEPLMRLWLQADALPRDERSRLAEQLAAAVLSGADALLERLAPDDPLRRHAEPARAALASYCSADDAALESALAEIPFRSPYRSWALLLKALTRVEAEPAAAREMLARIQDDSPFAPLRRAAELALLNETDFLAAISEAGPQQLAFAAALRRWSPQQLELARALAPIGDDAAGRELMLRLLTRHRDLLGVDWVRRASLRLLPPIANPWDRRPAQWKTLSPAEAALVEAWNAELHHSDFSGWDPIDAWEAVAEAMIAEPGSKTDPEQKLAIAQVFRRFDACFNVLAADAPPDDDPDSIQSIAADHLERSLRWDPGHRDTYIRLITWYRCIDQLKDARRLLALAQKRWPQDMTVLEAAMEVALASNAFKKAAGIARQMLAIDPINSSVRRRLVDAHIQHAAKQLHKGRDDLAHKELADARSWTERGTGLDAIRHQLALLDGLVVLALGNRDEGRAILSALLEGSNEGVAGQIELILATNRLGLRQSEIAQWLGLKRSKVRDRDDLLRVIELLRGNLERTNTFTRGMMDRLAALLKGAPWKQLERDELELACETLRAYKLNSIRGEAARIGLKRWPRMPMLEYHEFESRYIDGGFPSPSELGKMELALERAEAAGETRAAERLRRLMQQYMPIRPSFFDDPWDGDDGPAPFANDDDEAEFPFDALSDLLHRMPLKQVLEMTGMPKPLIKQVLKVARDEGDEYAIEMLIDLIQKTATAARDQAPGSPPGPAAGGRRRSRTPADDPDDSHQLDLF
ncbi:MAG: hypothetical protein C1943_13440 [Halochromatium sp.]|nr:hypothetical protein [Halochromatium sp.]